MPKNTVNCRTRVRILLGMFISFAASVGFVAANGGCYGAKRNLAKSPTAGHAANICICERYVHLVHVRAAAADATITHAAEMYGLTLALVESALAELPQVVAHVERAPITPGLARAVLGSHKAWRAQVRLAARGGDAAGASGGLAVALELCEAEGRCETHRAEVASRLDLPQAVDVLLTHAARQLGYEVAAAVHKLWSAPQSADPYALLLAGRAAAQWYGLVPPVPPVPPVAAATSGGSVGGVGRGAQRLREPAMRATFIDPKMPVAHWLAGRAAFAAGDVRAAVGYAQQAQQLRPSSLLWRADTAALALALGEVDTAWAAWQLINTRQPQDLRFVLQRAQAALARHQPQQASTILNEALPACQQSDPEVAHMQVAVAEAAGALDGANYDVLLERWQQAAPGAPEPVNRRIAMRIRTGRYREAFQLTSELAKRGQGGLAARQNMALAVALADWDAAIAAAQGLQLPEVARRLRIRAALGRSPLQVPEELAHSEGKDLHEQLATGEVLLAAGNSVEAERAASGVLAKEPWQPAALALRVEALRAQGRGQAAAQALDQLQLADPEWARRVANKMSAARIAGYMSAGGVGVGSRGGGRGGAPLGQAGGLTGGRAGGSSLQVGTAPEIGLERQAPKRQRAAAQ